MKTIEIPIESLILLILSSIRPVKAVNPAVKTINKKKFGALSLSISLWRLRNWSFSLSKVIFEFLLTIYGTPIIVTQHNIPEKVGNALSVNTTVNAATPNPIFSPKKNITFQKLSMVSLDFIKLGFDSLGFSHIPPYSLVGNDKLGSFVEEPCKLGMFSRLKSFMALAYNFWFYVYTTIIPKHYYFTKQIKALWLVLSFILCFDCSLVFAKNQQDKEYNKQDITYLIAKAEKDNQIPSGLLAAIAKVESGTKMYALNINGNAVFKESLEEASNVVKDNLALGLSNIDLGVMQLNYRWHGAEFESVTEMLMPENNIRYAASLLKSLRAKHGNWHKAVRYYHSAKPEYHIKYSRKVVMYWLGRDRTEQTKVKINS